MNIPTQHGFDFGTSNLSSDVFAVFDRPDFPDITPEDIETQMCSTKDYAWKVYCKSMALWEKILDDEIVNELRESPDFEPASLDKIAISLGASLDSVQFDYHAALTSLRNRLESDSLEDAA